MVSSFSRPCNTIDGVLISVDAFAKLPGSVILPPVYSDSSFVSQKHEVNPALAFNLLGDIQSVVSGWQEQLRQLVQTIHALQAQGPMVDGWIEACNQANSAPPSHQTHEAQTALLRHGDTEALMQYIEALDTCTQQQTSSQLPTDRASIDSQPEQQATHPTTQYRLCSLDTSGRVNSQPCPTEQIGIVSLAIARHQKFKQLLSQKQAIETKLQKVVDQLTGVRGTIQHID